MKYSLTCSHCDDPFQAKRPEAKYCSEECRIQAFIQRRKEKSAEARIKQCPSCGVIFQATRKDAIYCSPAHRQRMYRLTKD